MMKSNNRQLTLPMVLSEIMHIIESEKPARTDLINESLLPVFHKPLNKLGSMTVIKSSFSKPNSHGNSCAYHSFHSYKFHVCDSASNVSGSSGKLNCGSSRSASMYG